jgi:hypothetical protein
VLCDSDTLLMTKVSIDDFIIKYNIPILFITNSNKDVGLKVFTFDGGLSILDQLNEYMECKELPAILKI